jgi:8-oxo-dGTP diphosphatase
MKLVADKDVYAVNLFYQNSHGNILGVSRRNDHFLFGLPGGKVNKDESPVDAIIREVKEECGLRILIEDIIPIFEREDEDGKIARTYTWVPSSEIEFNEGIHEEGGGLAKWVTWDDLISGAFAVYNYRLGMHFNRFLKQFYFVSYTYSDKNKPISFKNILLDVPPLTWAVSENKREKSYSKITIISFNEIEINEYNLYKNTINK